MPKKKSGGDKESAEFSTLEKLKKLAIVAMVSDDDLLDELVLKGGNAMALIHKISARESLDLDFSMRNDFADGIETTKARIVDALQRTFRQNGYEPFDIDMTARPAEITPEKALFWGGYVVEFKLATLDLFSAHRNHIEKLRRECLNIGQGKKFLIEISRFEYVEDKEAIELDGYVVYVYSPLMIACEKLRAICQQMEEYKPTVHPHNRSQRARDFLDIHTLVQATKLDLISAKALELVHAMFTIKHVPVELLGLIGKYREFHRQGFPAVTATVTPAFALKGFDVYYDFVLQIGEEVLTKLRAKKS